MFIAVICLGVGVRSIAAGDNHSTFLDDLGRVWLCGTYKVGRAWGKVGARIGDI